MHANVFSFSIGVFNAIYVGKPPYENIDTEKKNKNVRLECSTFYRCETWTVDKKKNNWEALKM